jgi:hypothetical protein
VAACEGKIDAEKTGGCAVPKELKAESARKPPSPSESHDEIDAWMRRLMPDLQPLVNRLDELIRTTLPQPQHYAVKWKKAYYGLPERGWVIEMVAYDVSVNVVFLAGAAFAEQPPLGSGPSRYVKLRTLDEIEQLKIARWIEQACQVPGWR